MDEPVVIVDYRPEWVQDYEAERARISGVLDDKLVAIEHAPHPEMANRQFFRKGKWRAGTHHVHVVEYDGAEWHKHLRFRDYLRAHPEACREYQALKEELAQRYKFDRQAYTDAKSPLITSLLEAAWSE